MSTPAKGHKILVIDDEQAICWAFSQLLEPQGYTVHIAASAEEGLEIAAKENLQLPQTLDAKHQAVKQKLAGLKDDAFDREYKKHMEMGHQEAVALFESASQTPQMSEDLKEFAASTLPTLEKHHDLAKGIDTKKDGV